MTLSIGDIVSIDGKETHGAHKFRVRLVSMEGDYITPGKLNIVLLETIE
jgi:hypothetical protein